MALNKERQCYRWRVLPTDRRQRASVATFCIERSRVDRGGVHCPGHAGEKQPDCELREMESRAWAPSPNPACSFLLLLTWPCPHQARPAVTAADHWPSDLPCWPRESVSWPFKPPGMGSLPYGVIPLPGAGSMTAAVRNVFGGDLVPGDRHVGLIYPHCSIKPKAGNAYRPSR